MKNHLTFLIIVCSLTTRLSAQNLQFAVKAGYNLSKITSQPSESSPKSSFQVGGYVDFRINQWLHLQPELIYSRQGEIQNMANPPDESKGKTVLSYFNIPMIFKADLGKVVNFQIGPQYGILLSAHSIVSSSGQYANESVYKAYRNDLAVVAGFGIKVMKRFELGVRYNFGFNDINNYYNVQHSSFSNRVASVFLVYKFKRSRYPLIGPDVF